MKTHKNSRRSTIQPERAKIWPFVALVTPFVLHLIWGWTKPMKIAFARQPQAQVETDGRIRFPQAKTPGEIQWLPDVMEPKRAAFATICMRHSLSPRLCPIVGLAESAGNYKAVSPAGAVGMMQIMPMTADSITELRQMEIQFGQQLDNALVNIDGGAWLLNDEIAYFETKYPGDEARAITLAAAAYNGGRGAADQINYDNLVVGGDCASIYAGNEMLTYACFVGGMNNESEWERSPTYEAWLQYGWPLIAAAEQAAAEFAAQN